MNLNDEMQNLQVIRDLLVSRRRSQVRSAQRLVNPIEDISELLLVQQNIAAVDKMIIDESRLARSTV